MSFSILHKDWIVLRLGLLAFGLLILHFGQVSYGWKIPPKSSGTNVVCELMTNEPFTTLRGSVHKSEIWLPESLT